MTFRPLPEVQPDLGSFGAGECHRWEDEVVRPALEAQGWKVLDFVSVSGGFRAATCSKHGRRVRFWYSPEEGEADA